MKKPQFKIAGMIHALGGDHAVVQLLDHYEFPAAPAPTVAAWRRRNSAPGEWALALLYICVREGVLDSLDRIRIVPRNHKAEARG